MRVVIAGGHGKIARLLERELTGRGATAVGLIRNLDHAAALRAAGALPVACDLERAGVEEVAGHLSGADAVVFAAGAGPGSGAARKDTVDRAAAVLLADAAQAAGVRRYLLVSSMGVDQPPAAGTDEVWAAYLAAKKAAEDDIRGRDLDATVLRPGRLTDDPPTGRITLAPHVPPGAVTRTDVARVLVALLQHPGTAGAVLELTDGDTPIADAVAAVDTP
ncbi:NAD(P)H-binding protein [Micromonospora mirobrigensis]|uniref:Nucleoside-diphosphate-sugar epimerase n=1 Tax=Micromonospora mirobrigensis TaxID=262898 RepID=A0A1C4YFP3_9ACTN|nr:NAD(P)H-binding protein [Micromonospora mirobrigensis]SCF19533.1 Nucleoside-diphosphate-sugar epimerase [Micromonospora mirobrigensis]